MILNIVLGLVLILALLAVVTAVIAARIARAYPPVGRFVPVSGGHLHVLELGVAGDAPPVVLLHGASGNLHDIRLTLGARLAQKHRVILIDRPGHGWSDRPGGAADAVPARQAELIAEALDAMGVKRAIFVAHSWSGALATAYALAFPERVAGLVLLAHVAYPWEGEITWYYRIAAMPVIGPLFARTIVLPVAYPFIDAFSRGLFTPQVMPATYVQDASIPLVLRPREFVHNARDVAVLKASVARQSLRYPEITAPTVIITGDRDTIVWPEIHSHALAAVLPQAKLIMLPGIGHAVEHVAVDVVAEEVERLSAATEQAPASARPRESGDPGPSKERSGFPLSRE